MSGQDDLPTRRLTGPHPPEPDTETVRLTEDAPRVDQSWTSVPLAGDDTAQDAGHASPDLPTLRKRPPAPDPEDCATETVRLPEVRSPAAGTVRLRPADRDAETVRLRAGAGPAETVRLPELTAPEAGAVPTRSARAAEPPETAVTTAEFPAVAYPATEAASRRAAGPAPAPAAPDGLRRFGPGVPADGTPAMVAAWRGTPPPAPARRKRRGAAWTVALLVVLAVLALLLWQRSGRALAVTGLTMSSAPGTLSCDRTETVTATVRTNGRPGTLRYHWRRSDGTDGGPQRQAIGTGQTSLRLPLRWTFHGHGSYHATASLEIDGPGTRSGSATFTYACR